MGIAKEWRVIITIKIRGHGLSGKIDSGEMRRFFSKTASSMMEYAVLILAIVLAFTAMRGFIRAYIEGHWRSNISLLIGDAQYNNTNGR